MICNEKNEGKLKALLIWKWKLDNEEEAWRIIIIM